MRGPNVIYVGNLPNDIKERELQELFEKFGSIRAIDIKIPPRPPPFAFIEFNEARDAEDAAQARDGYDFYGTTLRVELARGGRPSGGPRGGDFGGRGGGGGARGPPRGARGNFRVLIKGLPASASWQDLKDHFRQYVKPAFTDVYRDRGEAVGVAEFETMDDMLYAIKKLDDTEFKNPFEKSYIRLVEDNSGGRGGGYGGGGYGGGGGGYGGGGHGGRGDYGGRGRDDYGGRDDRDRERRRSPTPSRSRSRSRSRSS
ncbi:hypothetical protein OEZ86_010779 [Tetradesmus obliquus]|nr:hypothetical protein OEZ86_010779 [Tetradesmus obliquus]